ncbi:hypothetical protein ACFSUP_04350 [Gracilibacillus thailandensis]|uniref:hypothetical protein n=1 Tax=Gracilibacillus thailandensis TaxID=563735 RepID=UPI00364411F0
MMGEVRMHLAQAVTRSCDGAELEVRQHLAAAERRLHDLGEHDLAERAVTAVEAGPATVDARTEMRNLMQLLDAAEAPEATFQTGNEVSTR